MDRSTQSPTHRLEFGGSASEYFGIWIVNIALSIVTLGIYSAWAKVRKLKYLYGHTRLDGAPFDYLGDPVAILKGRAIAFLIVVAYSVASNVNPIAALVVALLVLVAMPWLVVRSLRFKARNTAYRGLRFDFRGTIGQAAMAFGVYFLLIPLSLGIASPFVVAEQRRFIYNHLQYGTTQFALNATTGQFYRVFMMASLPLLVLLAAAAVVFTLRPEQDSQPSWAFIVGTNLLILLYLIVLVTITTAIQAGLGNLIWNNVRLGPHRFISDLRFGKLLFINITNSLAIVFSIGLMMPWATIRATRYRLACLSVIAEGRLDEFVATEIKAVQATGEELADFLDIDVGL